MYMWRQYSMEETSVKKILIYTMKTVYNIFYFCHLVILSCMFIALKSTKHARKKYNMNEVANIFNNTHLPEVSSMEYCRHIYQIEALVKTFLLHMVSHSEFFPCNLQLQGTSVCCMSSFWTKMTNSLFIITCIFVL